MRKSIARFLRWLLIKVDRLESDEELRYRALGILRKKAATGTPASFERALLEAKPLGVELAFVWDYEPADCKCRLTVEFR